MFLRNLLAIFLLFDLYEQNQIEELRRIWIPRGIFVDTPEAVVCQHDHLILKLNLSMDILTEDVSFKLSVNNDSLSYHISKENFFNPALRIFSLSPHLRLSLSSYESLNGVLYANIQNETIQLFKYDVSDCYAIKYPGDYYFKENSVIEIRPSFNKSSFDRVYTSPWTNILRINRTNTSRVYWTHNNSNLVTKADFYDSQSYMRSQSSYLRVKVSNSSVGLYSLINETMSHDENILNQKNAMFQFNIHTDENINIINFSDLTGTNEKIFLSTDDVVHFTPKSDCKHIQWSRIPEKSNGIQLNERFQVILDIEEEFNVSLNCIDLKTESIAIQNAHVLVTNYTKLNWTLVLAMMDNMSYTIRPPENEGKNFSNGKWKYAYSGNSNGEIIVKSKINMPVYVDKIGNLRIFNSTILQDAILMYEVNGDFIQCQVCIYPASEGIESCEEFKKQPESFDVTSTTMLQDGVEKTEPQLLRASLAHRNYNMSISCDDNMKQINFVDIQGQNITYTIHLDGCKSNTLQSSSFPYVALAGGILLGILLIMLCVSLVKKNLQDGKYARKNNESTVSESIIFN